MKFIEPRVIHLASTAIDLEGVRSLLDHYEASEWTTDAATRSEMLIEIAGRLCYKSFKPGLNPNVTKVREGNEPYLANILKQKHGSVLEHGHVTYAILDCSRIFTHEIVRHRHCNFSQESLRFVRLTDLKAWFPDTFAKEDSRTKTPALRELMQATFEMLEETQRALSDIFRLDAEGSFDLKKKLTSAMRRLAPIGLATNIIITSNHRNWRHMIAQRTAAHAEEEIRFIFDKIAKDLQKRYPNIYQDMLPLPVDGTDVAMWVFVNEKV